MLYYKDGTKKVKQGHGPLALIRRHVLVKNSDVIQNLLNLLAVKRIFFAGVTASMIFPCGLIFILCRCYKKNSAETELKYNHSIIVVSIKT